MATHDYVIDNGTGAAVRTDLNNVLSAIVSNNSSSSEPSTKYAYQWWADTTTGILKIRNSSNNGWVELLQLDGTLTLEDGSASTPGLAFRDDLNTGIFSSGADNFDIATGGSVRANVSSTGLNVTGTVVDDGATHDGDVTFTGASANVVFDKSDNALEFADDAKAVFGTGGDLEIFHDASDSIINDAGTGDLKLQLGGSTKFQLASGGVSLTGGAAANITALSDGATITIDMATACHHSVTLGGNRTFAAPSNQVVGQAGSIFITQDGTGSRTASFNAAFKFVGGTAPTLSTAAAAVDRIDYVILSSNVIHCAVSLDVK
tara:strand:+ start:139 stop:1095 length:957 start_codon:yes stop_codon:yes gene_type:complete